MPIRCVNFRERDAHTTVELITANAGLAQARPNYHKLYMHAVAITKIFAVPGSKIGRPGLQR